MDSCGNSGFSGVVNGGSSSGFSGDNNSGIYGVDAGVNSGFAGLDLINMNGELLGVRSIFKPTDEELVAGYLYNKIYRGPDNGLTFPELEIYGEKGMEPWVIWSIYEGIKGPHQDYIYFFSNLKKLGKPKNNKKLVMGGQKPRWSRTVGDGGTWSETEPSKPIEIYNNHLLFGRFRKFRYEHKNKKFIHHAEWLMEEFTLENTTSDLALCRMKKNDGERGRKRKNRIDSVEEYEEVGARNTKSLKLQNMQSPNSDVSLCIEHQSYLSKEVSEAIRAVDEYTQATSNEEQLELMNLLEEELASNDQIPSLQDVESEEVNNNEHELHHQFDPGKHEQSSNEGDGLHPQQQIVPLFQEESLLGFADQLLNFDDGETDFQLSEEKLKEFWDGLGI